MCVRRMNLESTAWFYHTRCGGRERGWRWGSAGPNRAGRGRLSPASGVGGLFAALSDFNPAAAGHFLRGRLQHDFENAVVEVGLGAVGDRALWQRNRSGEAAIRPLGAVIAFSLLLTLLAPFAANRQHVVAHLDVDVVLVDAGQISTDHEVVAPVEHFDVGRPCPFSLTEGAAEAAEPAVDLVVEAAHQIQRVSNSQRKRKRMPELTGGVLMTS